MRINISSPQPLPSEGFIRLPQVLHVLAIGKSSFWEGVKAGRFPAPVKLGPRTSVWRVEDIRALIARLSEATRGERA
jgi:predicted DNA-binding transcriptional regulator AlpA